MIFENKLANGDPGIYCSFKILLLLFYRSCSNMCHSLPTGILTVTTETEVTHFI